MAPAGLRFEWRSLPANDPQVATELAVVTFTGRCEVLESAGNSNAGIRLGWTHISDGAVLPFAGVDCDTVRAFLLKGLAGLPPQDRQKVLGRAIGRVTAHELLHIFAKTAHHSAHGVDQPVFSVEELMADRLVFDDHGPELHILRVSRAPASPDVPGSPQAGRSAYVRGGCGGCHGGEGEGTRRGPVLRGGGRISSPVILAAEIVKAERKMLQRARNVKVATPSLAEEDLSNVASFLNGARD